MALPLVPNFPAAMRLEGRTFLVLGTGLGLGRHIAHALRQFGAAIFCCDSEAAAAEQVAFEVSGTPLHAQATSALQLQELLGAMTRNGTTLDGVIDLLDGARAAACAERARAASQHCAQQGGGTVLLVARGGNLAAAEGSFAAVVAELAQEYADDGVRVNGLVPAAPSETGAAGLVAFLSGELGRSVSGQVLLAGATDTEAFA